jgi:hypothetical protein
MEFLERGSLRPYVGKLTFPQIGGVLSDVLAGLAHAERRRVVHRDLKPENLLVTEEGQVKIADFGIAKATSDVGAAAFRTATGVTVGTPGYMAPEQAMAQEIGPWTDLYSVGCMAYEMCVGRLPFSDSEGPIAVLLRHVNEPIPPAQSVNPEVNADFSRWIDNLLVKEPERRTPSPAVAWEALEEILITTIGPRWRRAAALADEVATDDAQPIPHFQSTILPNEELVAQLAPTTPTPTPAAETPSDPTVTVAPRTEPTLEPRRSRRAWLVAGGALVVVIAVVALLALGGGGGDRQPAPPPTLAQGVRQLSAILDFSAAGNLLSKKHEYTAAVRNRTEVAHRLARFHPPQALRESTETLTRVTRLAIQFNRQRASGQDASDVDSQANALRHTFLSQFNPFAQRYLHRTYDIGEF